MSQYQLHIINESLVIRLDMTHRNKRNIYIHCIKQSLLAGDCLLLFRALKKISKSSVNSLCKMFDILCLLKCLSAHTFIIIFLLYRIQNIVSLCRLPVANSCAKPNWTKKLYLLDYDSVLTCRTRYKIGHCNGKTIYIEFPKAQSHIQTLIRYTMHNTHSQQSTVMNGLPIDTFLTFIFHTKGSSEDKYVLIKIQNTTIDSSSQIVKKCIFIHSIEIPLKSRPPEIGIHHVVFVKCL